MAIEVFISYSHKDQALREELEIHLSNLKRQDIISSWYDGDITPGAEWERHIMERLTSAKLILLLISADFIHSDFCYSIEMKQAIDRHNAGEARVIPVLLRPTDWQGAPFDKLKMLPTDAKAVTSWPTHDDAFTDIVRGIRASIHDLTNPGKTANPSLASSTTRVSIWNVPYQRNPLFTGREEILKRLYEALRAGKTAAIAQPQAISGLGGIGKTQAAVEYAYRYRDDYQAVLWVKAETGESIISDFVKIAQLLNLPEKQEQDQLRIVEAVKRWFQEHTGWLLTFDNADDLAMVHDFLPPADKGHILLTTRAHATRRMAQRIGVERMEPGEGALFLLHRAKILDADTSIDAASKTDQDTAREIVQAMDGLPLALEQAGAYIEETECGLQGYLRLYRARGVQLLKEHGEYIPDHPRPVATTWSLSFEKVEQANAAAAELLRFCAFLVPDAIPEELFTESAVDLSPTLEPMAANPSKFNAAIRELLKYSLVQRDPEGNTLSIHRLVQEVLIDQMDEDTQRQWTERTVKALNSVFPHDWPEGWSLCERYLPHVLVCATRIKQWDMAFPEAGRLLHDAGVYLVVRARFSQALPLLQRALAIREKVLGPTHRDTLESLSQLARLYWKQGQYVEAEPLYQQALAIREQQFGAEDPDTADSLNGLAVVYDAQGKDEQAEPLYRRALAIREKVKGPEHNSVAQVLSNLALLYARQGKDTEALPLLQRALAIREKAFGDNPNTADSLSNLAWFYSKQGQYAEALPLYQRALTIDEQELGSDSLDVADDLTNLARIYFIQGQYEEAESLLQRALAIREQQVGAEHPYTVNSLSDLAVLYHNQGNYEQAELLYQRTLAIQEQTIVADHPSIVDTLEHYATLLWQMQRSEEAAQLEERIKEIRARRTS